MNAPNFLLVVQFFHFVLAYWVLRTLLFKPGLAVIAQEDALDHGLEQKFLTTQEDVARQQSHNEEEWAERCEQLRLLKPEFVAIACGAQKDTSVTSTVFSPEDEARCSVSIKDRIVARLRR